MSMPSRNCSSPKRTTSGTTCTPSADASSCEMSEVLSVMIWITSLDRQHVGIVLLAADVQLELDVGMIRAQRLDERVRIGGGDVVTAIHGDQLGARNLRAEDR